MKQIAKLKILTAVFMAGTLFLLGGCTTDNKTQERVNALVDVLASRDAQAIYKACDEETRADYTVEEIAQRLSGFYDTLAVEKTAYDDVKIDRKASDESHLVYKAANNVTMHNGDFSAEATLNFTKDGEKVLIHWTPQTVVNDLTMDNEVKIAVSDGKRGTIFSRDGEVLAKDDENGVRVYPQGVLTGTVVGYVRAATAEEIADGSVDAEAIGTKVGRAGLEQAYQGRLSSQSGMKGTLSDHPDKPLFESSQKDGEDITTTLDLKVQKAAYNILDGEMFAEVSIEPKSGQVLAAADSSSYDPSEWTDEGMDAETYASHVSDSTIPGNGYFAERFTPCSTQKLLTTYCGFKAGTLTQDTSYPIYGLDWAPPGGWGSYKVHRVVEVDGYVNLHQALVYSDNIYFAQVGLDMGYDNFNNGMKSLGFSEELPTPFKVMPAQITQAGGVVDGHETGLADSSYGQYQVQVSPLQQALIYCSLQNGGNIMKPCFLMDEEPEVWKEGVVSQENIKFINQALREAVTVSHPSADRDYASIAGKTGTAEVGPDGSTNLGWMVGCDLDNPTTMNCIMVNFVENRGGSEVNAAYLGKLFDAIYEGGPYKPSGMESEEQQSEGSESAKSGSNAKQ